MQKKQFQTENLWLRKRPKWVKKISIFYMIFKMAFSEHILDVFSRKHYRFELINSAHYIPLQFKRAAYTLTFKWITHIWSERVDIGSWGLGPLGEHRKACADTSNSLGTGVGVFTCEVCFMRILDVGESETIGISQSAQNN